MAKRTLRILQINTTDTGGGAEKVAWDLFQAYRRYKYKSWLAVGCKQCQDPDILVIPNEYYKSRLFYMASYIDRQLPKQTKNIPNIYKLKRILSRIIEPWRYIEYNLGREDFNYPGAWHLLELLPDYPSIIHCHNLHGGYFDLRAIPWLSHKLPVVLTLHDSWLLGGHCVHSFSCLRWKRGCGNCPDLNIYPKIKKDATDYNWRKKRDIYAKSRVYVSTPCSWLMQKIEESILLPAILQKKVIPYGVDLTVFHPGDKKRARYDLKLPLEADILLFIARGIKKSIWRDYNILEDIAKYFFEIHRCRPMHIVCLGEEEREKDKQLGNVRIHFVLSEKDPSKIARYYQAADLYIHPAIIDTFPCVILEALACGTPVIATPAGGIPEQVEDAKTGFLVSSGETKQLVQKISELLENKNLWNSFSQRAVETAKERFDLNYEVEVYLNWYKEILENFN